MNVSIKFNVAYSPAEKRIIVGLVRQVEGIVFSDEISRVVLWVSPRWHSVADVERKVLKAKRKLWEEYKKNKRFLLAVDMVAKLAREGEIIEEDQKTIDFINKFKTRVFEKTAKVFNLPSRKEP